MHASVHITLLKYCDNSIEFKGYMQVFIDCKHMLIIRGRSYYP
jgi:hypothetical protein